MCKRQSAFQTESPPLTQLQASHSLSSTAASVDTFDAFTLADDLLLSAYYSPMVPDVPGTGWKKQSRLFICGSNCECFRIAHATPIE